jgi:hypothetical protein
LANARLAATDFGRSQISSRIVGFNAIPKNENLREKPKTKKKEKTKRKKNKKKTKKQKQKQKKKRQTNKKN